MKTSVVFGLAALVIGFFIHVTWSALITLPSSRSMVSLQKTSRNSTPPQVVEPDLGRGLTSAKLDRLDSGEKTPDTLSGEDLASLPPEFSLPEPAVEPAVDEVRASLAPPPPSPEEVARRLAESLTQKKVSFALGGKEIDEDGKTTLREAVAQIQALPQNMILEIRGHTDAEGTAAVNLKVSLKRAESVRDFLVRSGVAAEKLRAVGYGSTHPVAPNNTDSGRSANRRIEFLVRTLQ